MSENPVVKLKKIDQQIAELKIKQDKLQRHLGERIIRLLINKGAFDGDFDVLYGAILELTQKLKNLSDQEEQHWKKIAQDTLNWRRNAKTLPHD